MIGTRDEKSSRWHRKTKVRCRRNEMKETDCFSGGTSTKESTDDICGGGYR